MGEKNIFKKLKLFEKEGFYIVLFACLCIVAVTGVYISKNKAKEPQKVVQIKANNPPDSSKDMNPVLTQNKPIDKTKILTTSKSLGKSAKEIAKQANEVKKVKVKEKRSKVNKKLDSFKIIYPVKGEIVKKYDKDDLQLTKSLKLWETHEGIDIACEQGTEIKAAASGKIQEVITKTENVSENSKDGYGASITIEHSGGYRTVYANLDIDSIKLKKGETVQAGDVIGKVGDTSKREQIAVEGSHLHFELLKKSGNDYITVNPQNYLK